jgi:hypothetical protein
LGAALGAAFGATSGAALAPGCLCFDSWQFNQLDEHGGMREKQGTPRREGLKKHIVLDGMEVQNSSDSLA